MTTLRNATILLFAVITANATAQNTLPTSGNVGIGTIEPGSPLAVQAPASFGGGNGGSIVQLTGPDGYSMADFFYGGDKEAFFNLTDGSSQTTPVLFRTNGPSYINGGNVGIGTTAPAQKLEVAGYIQTDAGIYFSGHSTPQTVPYTGTTCGGDYAESVDVAGDRKSYEPGDVLVIGVVGGSDVLKSAEPYSTLVAGIYSTKPGTVGRRQTTDAKTNNTEVPMAMVGIAPTKVSAENGSIKRGDLLVTSSTLGYAMKGTDRSKMLGAVVGKALGSLDSGTGVIEVLVTLQ